MLLMRSLQAEQSYWLDEEGPGVGPSPAASRERKSMAVVDPYVPCVRWSDGRASVNWPCAGAAIGFSAALLLALVTTGIVPTPLVKRTPVVVSLIELPKDPLPAVPPPETKVEPVNEPRPMVVAPRPIVQTPPVAPPVQVITATEPAPVRATVVAPAQPGPTGPVSVGDLSSKVISAKPPKYPIESRRKREQGTVVLTVLLSTAGGVSEISVSRSSGSTRLDKAALDAVRRWQWSPTVVNGEPVAVKGIVEIPFVLQG